MPLRDHFRPPVDDVHSWDELHGMWPAVIVQKLSKVLPESYVAAPTVHLGTLFEVDVATYREATSEFEIGDADFLTASGGAVAIYSPPKPTLTLEPQLPNQDIYEVRVYSNRRKRRLVAAIEIVSPSNKDRPENRSTFVAKVAALLKNNICVSIVDVVSTAEFNLYADVMTFLQGADEQLGSEPPPMYAVTMRMRYEGDRRLMDTWYHPLAVGNSLPTLPVWIAETVAVSLELEATYEEICRTLRIR